MAKVLIGKKTDIPEGSIVNITAGGMDILVANIQGTYFAAGNICTHKGQLDEGDNDKELACNPHGAKWNLRTGQLDRFVTDLGPRRTFRIIIDDGILFVEI